MPVVGLDHVNIRTTDMARTVAFFRDALKMKVAPPPGMSSTDQGAWVYDENDFPVIHIGTGATRYSTDAARPFAGAQGSGAIHHVALRCQQIEDVRARLRALDIAFTENYVQAVELRQIFVREANDVLLELNFREA